MRYLSILFLLVSLAGCGDRFSRTPVVYETPYVNISELSRAILVYGSKVYHDRLLFLDDSVIYYDERITKIRLDFSIQPVIDDLWSSRELLVDTVEGFLTKINANKDIVSQLDHYPFTADDLEIYINYTTFFGKYVDLQDSALAYLKDGIAVYYTFTAFNCSQDCWDRRIEYYWQSKMFVQYHREGEALVNPKENVFKSVFDTERYIPQK